MKLCLPLLLLILLSFSGLFAQVSVNEASSANDSLLVDHFGEFSDWIELYNAGSSPVSLTGYSLSDDPSLPQKWAFPAGMSISGGAFLIVFASDRNTYVAGEAHTNFKLSSSGETVVLSNASLVVDQLQLSALQINDSYGRQPNGSSSLFLFDNPTPGVSNNGATAYSAYCDDEVIFSLPAGFYSGPQVVSLSGPAQIRYTTDGSLPDAGSFLYSSPIQIDSTQVIRAACAGTGLLFKKAYTHTYFFNEDTDLPVFSISTDPANLFDPLTGIYEMGPNADPNSPYFGANFWQDWERPLHVEYFDSTGARQVAQDVGVKIFGNYSRANAMKSLRLIARDQYGADRMEYKFFHDKNINSFKQLVLRGAGDDWQAAYMRDGLNREIAKDLEDFEGMAYQPCLVFINGQYWGVYDVRERIHEHYLASNRGVNPDSVIIIDEDGTTRNGSYDYPALSQLLGTVDMSVQSNFDLWKDSVDLPSMADYFAHNMYFVSADWPFKNIRLWRSVDGRHPWRYISYDLDATFDLFFLGPVGTNMANKVINQQGLHYNMLNAFLENAAYRDYFINRNADLMNTSFHPANVVRLIDSIETLLDPEMVRLYDRWGHNWYYGWRYDVGLVRNFANDRPAYARNHLQQKFGLASQQDLSLAVSPVGAGFIKINTVFPDTFPWTGVYYEGVPVTVTAHANPGYTFDHWQSQFLYTSPDTNRSLTFNLNLDESFTAHFAGSPAALNLTVSEINYHSAPGQDAGDWIELFNYSTVPLDLSGWTLRDEQDYHIFTFPEGTVIANSQYLVVCEDLAAFDAIYPNVSNRIGELGFALGNSGDQIRLYALRGERHLSLTYSDGNGWPAEADGEGPTLELIDPLGNLSDPANWFAGCVLGSPGGPFVGPCDTVAVVAADVVFSEINYHSAPFLDAGDWLECWNYGTAPIDLSGWVFQDSDTTNAYVFASGTVLAPGARLVLSNDLAAFASIFPAVTNVTGPFDFNLSNGGELLRLLDASGQVVISMTYDDAGAWPTSADGLGFTLELLDETGDLSDGSNWFAGCFGGSPGTAYATPCPVLIPIPDITVSEINYHSADTLDAGDWIELYNYGSIAAEISGWTLRNANNANGFVLPAGTTLAPGGRLVLAQDQALFNGVHPVVSAATGDFGFDLGNDGDDIRLFDASGALYLSMTYLDQAPWPVEADGQGYTLEQVSETGNLSGAANWFAGCVGGSPAAPFSGPCDTTVVIPLPDLTISEINYHSSDLFDAGDWLELWNYGADTADLSAWVMKDDDNTHIFTLPQGIMLAPGGRLVLSNDLGKFTTRHPFVFNVTGPFNFGLGNSGDQIRLFTPGGDLFLSMSYSDDLPWPAEPDGEGYTLELLDESGNLSDPANWFVGCFGGSPGTVYTTPCPPPTSVDPANLFVIRVFPNPNPGLFRLEAKGLSGQPIRLRILNSIGQQVQSAEIRPLGGALSQEIDLSAASRGMYLLLLETGNQFVRVSVQVE